MAEARQRHDWSMASGIMCLIAEIHRDPRRRSRPFAPADFDPFAPGTREHRLPGSIEDLKVLLRGGGS